MLYRGLFQATGHWLGEAFEVQLVNKGASGVLMVETPGSADAVGRLFAGGTEVPVEVHCWYSGSLTLVVAGHIVEVGPDPDFEAWTLTLSDGEMFVAVPGGGVTHWSPRI